eukprot:XP_011433439.1 PREDICTED: uncharacterized protein LOC105332502 [Crassostrea gigas]
MQIKLSKNVAACKLQSLDEDQTCLSEPRPSLETQSETEMEDTTCGAVDVYDSDDEFKIVKQKIEEEKNTGEDVKKTLAKSYKYPNHGQTGTTTAKKGQLLVTLLVLQCLPYAAGKSFDYGKQGLQEVNCGNFHSQLRNVTGPFSLWSMCEIRQQNTQCPMPYIGRCFPLIENNTEFRFTCIINSTSLSILLKDDQCILITKTKGSNDFLAQCYEKDDCLPGVTSPKPATTNIPDVTLASTSTAHIMRLLKLSVLMLCLHNRDLVSE